MAIIRRLASGRYQIQVRRAGYPTVSKTFAQKADAERWGREQDRKADLGTLVDQSDLKRTTLSEIVSRDIREVTPRKLGCLETRGYSLWPPPRFKSRPVILQQREGPIGSIYPGHASDRGQLGGTSQHITPLIVLRLSLLRSNYLGFERDQ
jgi:hypothetical protein